MYFFFGFVEKFRGLNELGVIMYLTEAVRKNPLTPGATNQQVQEFVKKWLCNAPDREGGRLARMQAALQRHDASRRKERSRSHSNHHSRSVRRQVESPCSAGRQDRSRSRRQDRSSSRTTRRQDRSPSLSARSHERSRSYLASSRD